MFFTESFINNFGSQVIHQKYRISYDEITNDLCPVSLSVHVHMYICLHCSVEQFWETWFVQPALFYFYSGCVFIFLHTPPFSFIFMFGQFVLFFVSCNSLTSMLWLLRSWVFSNYIEYVHYIGTTIIILGACHLV